MRPFFDVLRSAWPIGLALLQITVALWTLPLDGEAYEWAQYLLLGTLYPCLVLGVTGLLAWKPGSIASRGLALGLSLAGPACVAWAACTAWAAGRWDPSFDKRLLVLLAAEAALAGALAWLLPIRPGRRRSRRVARVAACYLLLAPATVAAVRLVWWNDLLSWVISSRYTLAVFLSAVALVAVNVAWPGRRTSVVRVRSERLLSLVGLALLAAAALRHVPLNEAARHHWGVVVGPAELVRQGGWLLWDVPSQYGFLSTLLIAWLPLENVWRSYYLVHVLLTLATTSLLFLVVRQVRPGVLNTVFAVALTLAVIWLPGGVLRTYYGLFLNPNVSPYRFCWCYALLAVLLANAQWGIANRAAGRRWLWLGCGVWLVGSLWSVESAVYCAATWLPAYAILAWKQSAGQRFPMRRSGLLLAWLAVPVLLAAGAVGTIHAYYVARLGHAPDWPAFWEYAAAFRAGYNALPISSTGAVWALLLVFGSISVAVVGVLERRRAAEVLALITGAWGLVWSTASYFIGRSHEANATNLAHPLCLGAAVVLYLVARRHLRGTYARVSIACVAPVLAVAITGAWGDRGPVLDALAALRGGYTRHLERGLPPIDPALDRLLHTAGIRPGDPVVLLGGTHLNGLLMLSDAEGYRPWTAWLPVAPQAMFMPLAPERSRVYLERFSLRRQADGWLLRPRASQEPSWLFEHLADRYQAQQELSDGVWVLTRYAWQAPAATETQ